MPQNPHLASWAREIWEKALETSNGLQLSYATKEAAISARFALYTARNANRAENERLYPDPEDVMHGVSVWDNLRASVSRNPPWTLTITAHSNPINRPTEMKEL